MSRLIGGYLLSLLDKFDFCFGIDNHEDNLCGFVLTINESEKYDKFIQGKWIEQLHQKYPNVDQVNKFQNSFSKFYCFFSFKKFRISLNSTNVLNGFIINIQFVCNSSLI